MQKRMLTGKKVKYTLEEKKELKKAALEQRDLYEKDHLGDFVKLYPVSEYQEQHFDQFIQHAHKLYEEWTGASIMLILAPLDIRRNTKKDSIENVSLLKKYNSSEEQQKTLKNRLYKNIQSKVNTNLLPKQVVLEGLEKNVNGEDQIQRTNPYYDIQQDDESKFAKALRLLNPSKLPSSRMQNISGIFHKFASSLDIMLPQTVVKHKTSSPTQNPHVAFQAYQVYSCEDQNKRNDFQQPQRKLFQIKKQLGGNQYVPIKLTEPEFDQHRRAVEKVCINNNGQFLRPKVFNLNFITNHLSEKMQKDFNIQPKTKIQSVPKLTNIPSINFKSSRYEGVAKNE